MSESENKKLINTLTEKFKSELLKKMSNKNLNSILDSPEIPENRKQQIIDQIEKFRKSKKGNFDKLDPLKKELSESSNLTKTEQDQLHSSQVQEIMGYIPNWIIRWGITTIVAIVAVILIGSWFVKYPDILVASIDITSTNPPVFLKAKSSGMLKYLLVKDKESVKKDQYLAVLESNSNYKHVLEIKNQLESFKNKFLNPNNNYVEDFQINKGYQLGDLQSDFESFLNSYIEYQQFFKLKYYNSKLSFKRDQLENTKEKNVLLKSQVQILEKEYEITQQQFNRIQSLYERQLISSEEMDNTNSTLLQKQYNLENSRITIANGELQIGQLNQEILELKFDSLKTQEKLETNVLQKSENLLGRITSWEQRYVLRAPKDGIASLVRYWSEDQNVAVGDNVLAVLPRDPSGLLGRIELPIKSSGKVKIGQEVNIKFINYPYEEYGILKGIIQTKSLVPEKDNYILTVSLPNKLKTNYGITLQFSQKMKGSAEIITEDLRLLERIFYNTRSYLMK